MSSTRALAGALRRPLLGPNSPKRWIHQSSPRFAITNLEMPAMSPTMTEGGIAGWKKKEGEKFTAGDVLLEIETDKATIDVEAQDDGVMGKILLPDGSKNIPVGKVIALLAEEGDDISNLEPPKEQLKQTAPPTPPPSKPTPVSEKPSSHPPSPPSHSRPLFPSVHRLLLESNVETAEQIKGTGVRGMLTKGDVLAYLGRASGPTGTFKEVEKEEVKKVEKKVEYKPLDGPALRRIIVTTMLQQSRMTRNAAAVAPQAIDFDSVLADYLSSRPPSSPPPKAPTQPTTTNPADYFDGLI